jgi:hypothetical protein
MPDAHHSIFRQEALQRYAEGKEKSVLLRLVRPRTVRYLWCLVGLLLMGSCVGWCARVPVYASGTAMVVRWRNTPPGTPEKIVVAAFFPARHLASVHLSRQVWLRFEVMGHRLSRSVMAIEPEIMSPDAVQQQFTFPPGAAQGLLQPVTVVIAALEPMPTGLPAAAYLGSVGGAEIAIGTRRVVSLFPVIGPLWTQ